MKINESKSAVARVFGRKFLGYALWQAGNGEVRRGVSEKALEAFKQRVRQLTRRNGGRSMAEVVERLRSYLLGWKGYFGLAQTRESGDRWMSGYVAACVPSNSSSGVVARRSTGNCSGSGLVPGWRNRWRR